MPDNCTTCRHAFQSPPTPSAPIGAPRQYMCGRFPPTAFAVPGANGQMHIVAQFPPVGEKIVCGEYAGRSV